MDFSTYKKTRLARPDYSRAGAIDLPIQKLCALLNSNLSFATLSSCSGRICLFEISSAQKKQGTRGLIKTHAPATAKEIWKATKAYEGKKKLLFISEPPILHVAAATLEHAQQLLLLGREAGFKKSGILSLGTYPIVELVSTEVLAIPVFDKKLLIAEQYVQYFVMDGNKKIKGGWRKIEVLRKTIDNDN
ncbi:MAG: tRNA wybutosine-synthesizing 3 family protein [Nanoarchaeota archaeon]